MVVGPDTTQVRYVLDLAEIPTVQARQQIDGDGDGEVSAQEADVFAADRCDEAAEGLLVALDGTALPLSLASSSLTFPEGQAGLVTTRLVCDGDLPGVASGTLTIEDTSSLDRVGWREMTIVGDGVTVDADVPADSSTQLLRAYPDAADVSPQRVTTATADVRPGGPPAPDDAIDGGGVEVSTDGDEGFFERLTTRYTDLIAEREVTPGFVLLAVVLAVLLGASHAVAPGHGKTVMAAYVVGERGSTRQALAIGATVALTHTVGTLLLGFVLQASETLAPERLYPYFGLFSGALIVVIGAGLLRSAVRRRRAQAQVDIDDHDHDHEHDVAHDEHHHHHDELAAAEPGTVIRHHGHTHVIPHPDMGWRRLIMLGVAGGLAPSPSALLVLLGAIALDRTALGIGLVAAYGLGLALVLVGGGLLLVRFRSLAERLLAERDGARFARLTTILPFVTGAAVVLGGIVVAARGFVLA